jgi:hypothetical protein
VHGRAILPAVPSPKEASLTAPLHHPPCRRAARIAVLTAVLLPLAAPAGARADDDADAPPERLDLLVRPSSVRFGFTSMPVGGNADKLLLTPGVTVARQLARAIAVEGTVGVTGVYRWTRSGLGAAGPALDVTCRVPLVHRENGALTAALGAQLSRLRRFGLVGLGHFEVAWQGRSDIGIEFLAGGGMGLGLLDSRSSRQPCSSGEEGCQTRFRAGDPAYIGRFAVGYAF